MGKKNEREKDGVEEKRRSGRHEIDKDGEKKRGDGRLGSTAYEKKVRISNSQAEEWKRGKWRLRSAT